MADANAQQTANEEKKGVVDLDKELDQFTQAQTTSKQQAKKTAVSKKAPKHTKKLAKSSKALVTKGKRKEAVARASIVSGKGRITVNGISVDLVKPREIRELIIEPIRISNEAASLIKDYDVNINVYGGGVSGQAQASRNALTSAILAVAKSDSLKHFYLGYDRNMVVSDHRRVEPKKFKGPKARARFQTSYR